MKKQKSNNIQRTDIKTKAVHGEAHPEETPGSNWLKWDNSFGEEKLETVHPTTGENQNHHRNQRDMMYV